MQRNRKIVSIDEHIVKTPGARTWKPTPFFRVVDAMLAPSALPSSARLVAIAIARRFNEDGFAYMSIADVATRTKLNWHTVWRALKVLRNATPQIIEMRRRANTARNRRGCYEFRLVQHPVAFTEARDRARAARFTPDHLRVLWNRAAREHGLLRCRELNAERYKAAADAIASNPNRAYWQDVIDHAGRSAFVRGEVNFRDEPAAPKSFDFLLNRHVQLAEGVYDDV